MGHVIIDVTVIGSKGEHIELGDGKIVQADAYAAILSLEDRQSPIIAVTFEGAKPVIGVFSLESLGLKVNPVTGKLEETRPKGIAYFYSLSRNIV